MTTIIEHEAIEGEVEQTGTSDEASNEANDESTPITETALVIAINDLTDKYVITCQGTAPLAGVTERIENSSWDARQAIWKLMGDVSHKVRYTDLPHNTVVQAAISFNGQMLMSTTVQIEDLKRLF